MNLKEIMRRIWRIQIPLQSLTSPFGKLLDELKLRLDELKEYWRNEKFIIKGIVFLIILIQLSTITIIY